MLSDRIRRLSAIEAEKAAARLRLEQLQLEEFKTKREIVFCLIAESGDPQSAKKLAAALVAKGITMEPGDLLQVLEVGVRQRKLKSGPLGYQIIRPAVLEQITRETKAR